MADHHATLAAEWLAHHEIECGDQTAFKALVAVAKENPFHPVREYLESLQWDGVQRIDSWLRDYLGVTDTQLHRAFSAKFLISAVARIFEPGCKVDTAPVLEGEQGLGKSQVCRALFGSEWFMDRMPEIATKDAQQALQGVWGIELAEMAAVRRSDANAVKAMLSTPVDRFRASYGRVTEDHPRQCVFIATVNPNGSGYLQDETGARRFWPVLCGATWPPGRKADVRAVTAVRGQLWAEAVRRYRSGEKWYLETAALEAEQAAAAAERYDRDEWQDTIAETIAGEPFARMRDLFQRLRIDHRDQTPSAQLRISRILQVLGWKRASRKIDGTVVRVYLPPSTGAKVVAFPAPVDGEGVNPVNQETLANLMG
jgi:predicted P-loop ATPase